MRTQFFGCPVDILSREDTIALARRSMAARQPCMHVSLNVAKLVNASSDRDLAGDLHAADIVGVDGMGIALAMKLCGYGRASRLAGADLFIDLMDLCARDGFRPYLLGAKPEVLDEAMARLKDRFPGLSFAGAHHGYFDGRDEDIVAKIRDARPDCLFLAMPSPRKERFMARWREEAQVPFVMGIGGTLDVVAGKVARAPALIQKIGFEWLYRLAQEPRRMWRRYLGTNARFALMLLKALLNRTPFRHGKTA